MISKLFKVIFVTFSVLSLSMFIVFTASYFHYSDAVEKQLCDEILVDFVYYLERCLYLWTVFNFLEIMLLLMVLVLYKTFFWSFCLIFMYDFIPLNLVLWQTYSKQERLGPARWCNEKLNTSSICNHLDRFEIYKFIQIC